MAAPQYSLGTQIVLAARLCAPGVVVSAVAWATCRLLERLQRSRQALPICHSQPPKDSQKPSNPDPLWVNCGLSKEEVERFGRQIILPKLGPEGQRNILQGSVLVVGAGGLGCPVALYLCAAGIGRMGIVDDDTVAVSNLHRQIGHSCSRVGENKATSLRRACLAINGGANVEVHPRRLKTLRDAAELMSGYDLVVDCTDAPPSRYLLNDAAVMAGRPLVAPSAVGLSGQLTIYNFEGGPCLRCIFPDQPNANASEPVASCAESGVMGPVPGILGTLAALETLKLVARGSLAGACLNGRMLLYDAMDLTQQFRTMKIRKRSGCLSCGEASTLGARARDQRDVPCPCAVSTAAIAKENTSTNIASGDVAARLRRGEQMVLVDVRPPSHFAVSHLASAENWPLPELLRCRTEDLQERVAMLAGKQGGPAALEQPIVCICRRGVDSMLATVHLRQAGVQAWNLEGGLLALAAATRPSYDSPALT